MAMTALKWRARRDRLAAQRKSTAYAQRMLELAVAKQIRAELRAERKAKQCPS